MNTVKPGAPILTFPLEGSRFAVELANVREVVLRPPLAIIPGAPDTLVGLLSLRGQPVVVADLRPLIGLAGRSTAPPAVVVIDGAPAPLGLAVDGMPRVESMPAGTLLPPAPELSGHGAIVVGSSEGRTLLASDVVAADSRLMPHPSPPGRQVPG